MKHYIILFLALAFGYSQGMNDDINLVQVRVSGNVITSENTIIFTSGLREGQTITPADFPRAIKRLWQLGLFQDIQIQYDEETNEGLSLTIIVKENFILGEIKYEGNKKLKDRKFEEEITLSKGQRISPNTLHETEESIRRIYAEKVYLNVIIDSELALPDEETTFFDGKGKDLVRDIIFKIQENDKIKIGKIIFEGNN